MCIFFSVAPLCSSALSLLFCSFFVLSLLLLMAPKSMSKRPAASEAASDTMPENPPPGGKRAKKGITWDDDFAIHLVKEWSFGAKSAVEVQQDTFLIMFVLLINSSFVVQFIKTFVV